MNGKPSIHWHELALSVFTIQDNEALYELCVCARDDQPEDHDNVILAKAKVSD